MLFKAKAFAKLNLFLDVLGKRPDGYHDIDSVMQSISLYDEISVSLRRDEQVTVTYQDKSFERENDIVYKAYDLFSNYSAWHRGVDIHIIKNIPCVAGLGGFSAVIATVLKILNRISEKNYSDAIMLSLCKRLGADVPFCYNGGTARARGIGEEIDALSTPKIYLVLLKEGEKQSTGEMYQRLDALKLPPSEKISSLLLGIRNSDNSMILDSVYNIFENCWDFGKMSAVFDAFSPDAVFLSGSGPTTVAAFCDKAAAMSCYERLKSIGRNVFIAETVEVGNIIE